MPRYLVFQLYGPLASWGEVAVGEARPSEDHPTRSAILGILGACLGMRREDPQELALLARGLACACEQRFFGSSLRDYHTAQVATRAEVRRAERSGRAVRTRRDELLLDGLKTILSARDYRENALARAVVVRRDRVVGPELDRLADALRNPRFTPYLGRRSCPAGLPFAPTIVEAPSLIDALDACPIVAPDAVARVLVHPPGDRDSRVGLFWDEDFPSGIDVPSHVFDRRDDPTPEVPRAFRLRRELHATRAREGD